MTAELVISALQKAIMKDLVKAGAIIHADRGSQYAANNFRLLVPKSCFRQSMSGKGNCYDNARAESFFSRFKAELLEAGVFEDVEQAESEVFSSSKAITIGSESSQNWGTKAPWSLNWN